jgi:acetylornithine/succinyldiaminopimelate/putrescine aminotransferase
MIAFTPFDGSEAKAKTLLQALFRAGVIAFVAGANPARVRFLPPVAATGPADVEAVFEILERTLAEVAAGMEAAAGKVAEAPTAPSAPAASAMVGGTTRS